ncbi:hypothetical protein OS493_021877 [Desmophyllum pertusum]|uniref:Uncharacterized protein n=1 Tax=Desmophyllum pertusum TaxID=174260 RepID=A0A9X0D2S1_9CNID|nr:hypothetical protein OS493_021877 [Desmophyllum pertusum]
MYLFSAVLALHVFLFQIKTTAPYPATRKVPQESLHVERDHQADELIRSMNATHHDGQYEVGNTSSHQLLFEHAHVRRARQASGCLISKAVEQCGNDSIVTVTCRARSVTCIQYGGAAPRCVIKRLTTRLVAKRSIQNVYVKAVQVELYPSRIEEKRRRYTECRSYILQTYRNISIRYISLGYIGLGLYLSKRPFWTGLI